MPRIQYVKKARQRYAMVPDLGPDGQQKVVPVLNRDGSPKTDKNGREITRRLTVTDKSQPLPNYKCEVCQKEIEPGQPYKFVEPKMGPMRVRCMKCPTWQSWDLSSSLAARIEQIQHEHTVTVSADETEEDVEGYLANAADDIRSLAEEKRESAANIEDGFGHATYQSDELNQIADDLENWADEIESTEIPERPDEEAELTEDELDLALGSWAEEATNNIAEALANSPV